MTSLDDAWAWYQGVSRSLHRLDRIATKYWPELPWAGRLGRDNVFRETSVEEVRADASDAADPLDDLAVFVLFSVFEAEVRDRVLADTDGERKAISHPALVYWMRQAEMSIEEGSFFRVLDGFKSPLLNDLIEQVNQVRRYRNWVAHGRRGEKPVGVDPYSAYHRLRAFLAAVSPA